MYFTAKVWKDDYSKNCIVFSLPGCSDLAVQHGVGGIVWVFLFTVRACLQKDVHQINTSLSAFHLLFR